MLNIKRIISRLRAGSNPSARQFPEKIGDLLVRELRVESMFLYYEGRNSLILFTVQDFFQDSFLAWVFDPYDRDDEFRIGALMKFTGASKIEELLGERIMSVVSQDGKYRAFMDPDPNGHEFVPIEGEGKYLSYGEITKMTWS